MTYKINIGDQMPAFKIQDSEGFELTQEDLLGSPVVVYFYPKDDTPGCTKEACSFRDNMEEFDNLDTLVIGVSRDTHDSHEQFKKKYDLNYTLLSDTNGTMCKAFDVLRDNKIERTTFLFDGNGDLRWVERPVNVTDHVERVKKALEHVQETA